MSLRWSKIKKKIIRNIRYTLKNPLTWFWVFISALLCSITFINFRTETEAEIETLWDSVWFTIVTTIAGYYEYSPVTLPGRIASLLLLVFGMLVLSMITGKLASYFMDMQMKKEKGLMPLKNLKGHFLLCGWRSGFEKILDNIINTNPEITPDLIVLINDAPSEKIENLLDLERFKEIHYVSGDFADENVLKRANIQTAERALIISDHSKEYSDLEIDSRTVLAVISMSNINPGMYIAAELIDSKFEKHLRMAHCDEIILTTDYEHNLLASASGGMGYSNVMRTLISDDADSGILIEDIPSQFFGKSYSEYRKSLSYPKILIGLLLNTGNFHQRRKDALREAQRNPDIKTVVGNLNKVKTLKSNQPVLTPPDDYIIMKNTKAIFVRGKPLEM
ncbi:MAG: potassium channel protein [Treponema sp.]|nr:potassium channel protein [Treponema sp.]